MTTKTKYSRKENLTRNLAVMHKLDRFILLPMISTYMVDMNHFPTIVLLLFGHRMDSSRKFFRACAHIEVQIRCSQAYILICTQAGQKTLAHGKCILVAVWSITQ